MRVLLAGDSHCDTGYVMWLFEVARRESCEAVCVVGDFGYWPRVGQGRFFLEDCASEAASRGIDLYWLDGNHEDHRTLATALDAASPRPVAMDERLWYLPRGCTWRWGDLRLMAFGGANSIDADSRVEGWDWFPEEVPTERQRRVALDRGPVDVLLTHDSPEGSLPRPLRPIGPRPDLDLASREWVLALARAVRPSLLVHGHHHERYSRADAPGLPGVRVVGLASNNDAPRESWMVLDTDDLASCTGRVS